MRMNLFWKNAISRVSLILLITAEGCCCSQETSSVHCDATSSTGHEQTRVKLDVMKINETSIQEPTVYAWLDVCLTHDHLRINWTIPETTSTGRKSDTTLCFDVKSIRSYDSILKRCFVILLPRLDGPKHVFCWFKLERFREKPYIEVLVTYQAHRRHRFFYGDLTAALRENCTDPCSIPVVDFHTDLISCNGRHVVSHRSDVVIEFLTFKGNNCATCLDNRLNLTQKTQTELLFSINIAYNGLGWIYYAYEFQGNYCSKYKTVRVICDTGYEGSSTASLSRSERQPHTVLIAVPLIVIVLLTFPIVIYFGFRWRRRSIYHSERDIIKRNNEDRALTRGQVVPADGAVE